MKMLIIDGYNAIYKTPSLRKLLDISLEEARRGITRLAEDYRRKSGATIKISIVFDGPVRQIDELPRQAHHNDFGPASPYESRQGGLVSAKSDGPASHVFARGHDADREIVELLKHYAKKYDTTVVSDDNFVRNSARAYKAHVLSIEEFRRSLGGQRAEKTPRGQAEKKELASEHAKEINSMLLKRWGLE